MVELCNDLARTDKTARLTYLLAAKVISYTKAAGYAVCNDNNDLASLPGGELHRVIQVS